MTIEQLTRLVAKGESDHLEFKKSTGDLKGGLDRAHPQHRWENQLENRTPMGRPATVAFEVPGLRCALGYGIWPLRGRRAAPAS